EFTEASSLRSFLNRVQQVAGSNPVASTILRNEPFGEYVEGLFHCEDASYRSTSVFKWHCTTVELTMRSDGSPLFPWRNVVQIPSSVLVVVARSFEAEFPVRCSSLFSLLGPRSASRPFAPYLSFFSRFPSMSTSTFSPMISPAPFPLSVSPSIVSL